jgi:hypothetical protein
MVDLTRESAELLARVREVVRSGDLAPLAKPSVIALKAHVPTSYIVPLLKAAEREGLGQLVITVVDSRRLPIASYRSLDEVPAEVVDEMGVAYTPSVENLEWAFDIRPAPR